MDHGEPDISTLEETGHLYFGATQKPRFFRQSAYPLVAPVGCGAHRITHVKPSMRDEGSHVVQRTHAHGIGPLLVGVVASSGC